LRLSSAYGGILEGYPCKVLNDRRLEGLIHHARDAFPSFPVHLVPPVRDYPDTPAGAFGPVEVLPVVTCMGAFTSQPVDPDRDSVLYFSALTIVWFQASLSFPSGEDADSALRAVCWNDIAADLER
jgi:hypothetical protein